MVMWVQSRNPLLKKLLGEHAKSYIRPCSEVRRMIRMSPRSGGLYSGTFEAPLELHGRAMKIRVNTSECPAILE